MTLSTAFRFLILGLGDGMYPKADLKLHYALFCFVQYNNRLLKFVFACI
jgi:hypothetical protein